MGRLFIMEWRKVWTPRLPFACLILLLFNVFFYMVSYTRYDFVMNDRSRLQPYLELMEYFGGDLEYEKAQQLNDWAYRVNHNVQVAHFGGEPFDLSDIPVLTDNLEHDNYLLQNKFLIPMRHAYRYEAFAKQQVLQASPDIDFYTNVGNFSDAMRISISSPRYQDRACSTFIDIDPFRFLLRNNLSILALVILVVLFASSIITSEYESDMVQLISTPSYRSRIMFVKISSLFVWVLGTSLTFFAVDALMAHLLSPSPLEWSIPIYQIPEWKESVLGTTVWGQYLVICGLRVLALCLLSLICMALSAGFRYSFMPAIIALTTAAFLILFGHGPTVNGLILTLLNPLILLRPGSIFKQANYLSISRWSLPLHTLILFILVIYFVIALLCVLFVYDRRHRKLL